MFDEAAMMLPIVLKCPSPGCTCGHGGARWRTPPFPEDIAMGLMDIHRDAAHGQQIGGGDGEVRDGGGDVAAHEGGVQISSLSGPGQAPVSKRYRAQ